MSLLTVAAPIQEAKPLSPETILKTKREGKATVEFVVSEVPIVNMLVPASLSTISPRPG